MWFVVAQARITAWGWVFAAPLLGVLCVVAQWTGFMFKIRADSIARGMTAREQHKANMANALVPKPQPGDMGGSRAWWFFSRPVPPSVFSDEAERRDEERSTV